MTNALDHLLDAHSLAEKLRADFKPVADLFGPTKAFYIFAGELTRPYQDDAEVSDFETKIVQIVRAVYDEYVASTK